MYKKYIVFAFLLINAHEFMAAAAPSTPTNQSSRYLVCPGAPKKGPNPHPIHISPNDPACQALQFGNKRSHTQAFGAHA